MPASASNLLSQKEWRTAGRLLGVLRPGRMARIRGAEVFEVGYHKDSYYSAQDLDEMARNFNRARGTVDPPLVVGHEEHQFFTGTPAVGWVERVYRRGNKLYADFSDVPPSIAKLINRRAYRKVSAEVYNEPPPGAPQGCRGKMLRRVALLGGEMPYIKTIADLPMAEFSEGQSRDCRPWAIHHATDYLRGEGSFAVFYEVNPMADDMDTDALGGGADRQGAIDNLVAAGVAQSEIDALAGVDDNVFLSWAVARLAAMQGADAGVMPPVDEEPVALAEFPEGMTREDVIAELVAMGEDEANLQTMTDDELLALYQSLKGETMSEARKTVAKIKKSGVKMVPFSERQLAAIEARQKRLEAQQRATARLEAQKHAKAKRGSVTVFCETMVKAGKLTPAQAEAGKGSTWKRLMRADAIKGVAKFGEETLTELDLQMREIEQAGPVRRYGQELLADPEKQSEYADVDKMTAEYAARRNKQAGYLSSRN